MDAQKIEAAFKEEFIGYEFPSATQRHTAKANFGLGYQAAIRELLATHTAEIAAREAEIARLREALQRAGESAGFQYMTHETQELINAALTQQPPKD